MRVDPRAWPITLKIGLAISLTVFAGALVAALLVQSAIERAQLSIVQEDFQSLSAAQLERIVEVLTRETSLMVSLAHEDLLLEAAQRGGGVEVPSHLNAFVETFPQFEVIILTDHNGQVIGTSYAPVSFDLQGRPWWQSAYANGAGAIYISDPVTDPISGATGVQIAVPLLDEDGSVLGIVMAVWDFDLARQTLISGTPRHTEILDSIERRVLADTTLAGIETIRLPGEVTEQFFTSLQGAFLAPDEEGIPTVFGYTNLAAWPREVEIGGLEATPSLRNLGWSIVVRAPVTEATAGIIPLVRQLQALIAGSAIVAVLFALVILRGAMDPLYRLTAAAARIGTGEIGTPIPELPLDEIGRLAGVLREMVAKLVHRQEQLSAAARISRATILSFETEQMLGDALHSLARWFDYSEARVYLLDSGGRHARLRVAIGEESERLLGQRHRMEVTESTLIGQAILLDEPQTASSAASAESRQVEAPSIRSEAAIPLRTADRPLGALYVASTTTSSFEPGDVEVLRLVADQLSASLENIHLHEQSQSALAEIEALNRRLTRSMWEERMASSGQLRHTLDPEERWPESLEEVRRQGKVVAEPYVDGDGRSVLAAPIILRGESIGVIGVTRPSGHRWSPDEIALVEAIAARVAMIAESIRLVDESTRVAQREQIISSVSEQLQRAVDVDSVVMTALGQLGKALGSGQVSLRIGPPPVDSDRQLTSSQQDSDEAKGGDAADA